MTSTETTITVGDTASGEPYTLPVEEIHEYLPQQGSAGPTGEILTKIAKRGRKRGLGIAGLSQRPADVDKAFITQADLLVWHRLTWENDTQVVRRVVSNGHADRVDELDDGQAFVQADWDDIDVETVQFRRKHTFDAGATPGLDDVDRPELKSIGDDLVDELEEISAEQERRHDRIAQLEATIEKKDERIAELEEEIERLKTADETLDLLTRRLEGPAESDVSGELQGRLEEKHETIAKLREERDTLQTQLEDARDRAADLEAEVDRLQAVEERIQQAERIEEQLAQAREALGVEIAEQSPPETDERVADLQARIDELEAENERLREQVEQAGGVTVPTDYQDFIQEDVVQDAIDEAKSKTSASPRYVKGVVAAIVQEGGPVDYETVADRLGVSTTSDVSKAASTLETLGVLERVQQSPARVDFDLDGVAEIKEAQQRRQQAEAVMDDL